ncbi:MAG: hypothetical protein COT24_01255 [Candidatus Kerfeldbacteria bacterium CG08_land_8_20_14_0_20_40_16]|uniref:Uncharacterized protein n=1 Tax=Candidatus Kerfeldbacteria bacterium CG08_land_8_20_14_0_20_40_16 TaxID=2014244 RepID=A0A2H0YX73_9BACT|nr:MAG: hypothetical protein COT24_01255 [Candidatus Kerfeldbacteria bacterium CG08_land_8_20_14_0_20_40_16]
MEIGFVNLLNGAPPCVLEVYSRNKKKINCADVLREAKVKFDPAAHGLYVSVDGNLEVIMPEEGVLKGEVLVLMPKLPIDTTQILAGGKTAGTTA